MQLASRFGHVNQIRRERPLTREELMYHVPSIFGEDRHTSRSERYAYIPTITVLENLQREGFQPFFACQTRVRDQSRREYTKHMLRLRRAGQITGQHVPEIILLNSHDGSSQLPDVTRIFSCHLHQWPGLRSVAGRSPGAPPGKRGGQGD
ncbi:CP4-57 prophage protein [Escherichia coli]|uniref:CP4-57 prophage protein n=1 Tax=Escherichia coli TaxID=562 RepID=A0A3S4MH23_ECOLX|nr:CP4-57 prophage protein [Escherichia coli]